MTEFKYKAVKKNGELYTGQITCASKDDAILELNRLGSRIIEINPINNHESLRTKQDDKSLKSNDILMFTSELAILLNSGLPLDRALKIMLEMSSSDEWSVHVDQVLTHVKNGKPLSFALEQGGSFDGFYISMVKAGEASGRLSEALSGLSEHLERSKVLKNSVISALIYPLILVVVAILSLVIMLGFVVPQFEALFADMGDSLPMMTVMVIAMGDFVKFNYWVIILVVILLYYAIKLVIKKPEARYKLDAKILNLPIIGAVVFKYHMTQYVRTLGTLLKNGVPLLLSVDIATNTVSNIYLNSRLAQVRNSVKQGKKVYETLQSIGTFSPMMVQMIRVGEETGKIDKMLLELAKIYGDDVESGVKRLLTLLEPLLILLLGGIISFIIISILMGILSINDLAL